MKDTDAWIDISGVSRTSREPYVTATRSRLVFYPHGNLALATDLDGNESKLSASIASNLLSTLWITCQNMYEEQKTAARRAPIDWLQVHRMSIRVLLHRVTPFGCWVLRKRNSSRPIEQSSSQNPPHGHSHDPNHAEDQNFAIHHGIKATVLMTFLLL
jgi:hypothetical protein